MNSCELYWRDNPARPSCVDFVTYVFSLSPSHRGEFSADDPGVIARRLSMERFTPICGIDIASFANTLREHVEFVKREDCPLQLYEVLMAQHKGNIEIGESPNDPNRTPYC